VLVRLRVNVPLCKAHVNNVESITFLTQTHQEVVGLDISMDEQLFMHVLEPFDELVGQLNRGSKREFVAAELE